MKKRALLMIPGPIEFEPEVLSAMGAPTASHVSVEFIEAFGQALEGMRQVFLCNDGQPFVLAGSGTLAMDAVGANLVEPGDEVLVINTGYFGDRYKQLLERYGANVTQLHAPIGDAPSLEQLEAALQRSKYKLITLTHVDTSTGVLVDVKAVAGLAQQFDTLLVVDGVCSVAGEALYMSEWGVDVVLTASQKAIGVPPGLALFMVGPRALQVFKRRKTPVLNYYADWNSWLPVMQAYEARKPSYFGTPAVNLVMALNVSLGNILKEGMQARFERHVSVSKAFKSAMTALGLISVPRRIEVAAHTMTAPRYPRGIEAAAFLPKVAEAGAFLAGGLHPEIKNEYFRIGHMGSTSIAEVLVTVGAIEFALTELGHSFKIGAGVEAAMQTYYQVNTLA